MNKNPFRELRKEKNPSLMEDYKAKDLAKDLGIPAPKISELENNKRSASLTELKAYHKYFNVPYEYLLGENDSRYYQNMALSDELGLNGTSIEYLKRLTKCLNHDYDTDSVEYQILRALNYLLDPSTSILSELSRFLNSALNDIDTVQTQYVGIKYDFEKHTLPIVNKISPYADNFGLDNINYQQFCEMRLQKIILELRNEWEMLHNNYLKETANKKHPIPPDSP
ncbi:helix-turn-helix domain-containing protein [Blautia glucerasea]|uniref:helix-turn-helix domain-containing protein n=1 Tax=Blautia glucerasea TaxID=536633 RepID=UPI001D0788FE|nr:helix-turn-helix transcriptional regulator [Blautia glucerasea]MCB6547090.1 helix-turn-helix domain-containing protein [Blautia glucerasea]